MRRGSRLRKGSAEVRETSNMVAATSRKKSFGINIIGSQRLDPTQANILLNCKKFILKFLQISSNKLEDRLFIENKTKSFCQNIFAFNVIFKRGVANSSFKHLKMEIKNFGKGFPFFQKINALFVRNYSIYNFSTKKLFSGLKNFYPLSKNS